MSSLDHKHILVIENDPYIRDAIEIILKYEHCIVHTCNIKHITHAITNWYPDIAIIDIPYSNFPTELEKIITSIKQKTKNHTTILLLSTNKNIKSLAREIGANDYLEEPFDVKELLQKLTHLSHPVTIVTAPQKNKSYKISVL